ncbi:MAG: hypothetical protein NUV82_01605 [Candidatus Komeilibacteria bacterium]|nr:hypothetical protein [Candidatus Komeilibacteria bacterium]
MIKKEDDAKLVRALTPEERAELGLDEIANKPESRPESFSPIIKAVWENPETNVEREIEIDFEQVLNEQTAFYKNKLELDIDQTKVIDIWNRNYAEIKEEMEKYGYDSILIVPDDLPEEEVLNQKLIESMEENVGGKKIKVNATWQSNDFTNGGSFAAVRNLYPSGYRIVLTHSDQNIFENPIANPYLKATLNKDIMQLTGLDAEEVAKRIAASQEMKVNFMATINGQEIEVQAEGGSLEEYVLQQSIYFEKTGKHLDENGWTWLLKSYSGSRVVNAGWDLDGRLLVVDADSASARDDFLGLRLSRSFT